MDLLIVDASALPDQVFHTIKHVEMFGENIKIDDLASQAKVIAYEILTGLGKRVSRNYIDQLSNIYVQERTPAETEIDLDEVIEPIADILTPPEIGSTSNT